MNQIEITCRGGYWLQTHMEGKVGFWGKETCALERQISYAGNNGVGDRHSGLLSCADAASQDEKKISRAPELPRTKERARGRYATFGGGDADDGEAETVAEDVGLGLGGLESLGLSLGLGGLVALGLAAAVVGEHRVGVVGERLHIHVHVQVQVEVRVRVHGPAAELPRAAAMAAGAVVAVVARDCKQRF